MKLSKLFTFLFLAFSLAFSAQIKEKELDKLIQNTLTTFDVPVFLSVF
mgnify:CR=1 FL=1